MASKIYIVHEKCTQGYEKRWENDTAYFHESNALQKLQDVKTQDMMPIVEEENYRVVCDEPTHFEAISGYDASRGNVCVKITPTVLVDVDISKITSGMAISECLYHNIDTCLRNMVGETDACRQQRIVRHILHSLRENCITED